MKKVIAHHSRITRASLAHHSRITRASLAHHSRITRASLAHHSRFKVLIFILALMCSGKHICAQQFQMQEFMGINLRREDPIQYLNAVGFVREYHSWVIDESNWCNNRTISGVEPANRYGFNSSPYSSVRFDTFYNQMRQRLGADTGRVRICATMNQCLPYLAGGDSLGYHSEMKPVRYNWQAGQECGSSTAYFGNADPFDSPNSYKWVADWIYQFTRRYGNRPNLTETATLKLQAGEIPRIGLNSVGYIELWNEANKYWITGEWKRVTQFTGQEYAAMASRVYDAHNITLNSELNSTVTGTPYRASIADADNSMKFVMAGTAGIREYDWKFIKDAKLWCDFNRATNAKKVPFDVINFHHYNSISVTGASNQGWSSVPGTVDADNKYFSTSPESDRWRVGLENGVDYLNASVNGEQNINNQDVVNPVGTTDRTFKQRLVELRYRITNLFAPQVMETWLSEFGFDTNDKSPYKTPKIYKNGVLVADQQDVQAQWLLRGYLEVAAAKWDRAMIFDLRDEATTDGSLFRASGLLLDRSFNFAPKKSYYAVATMKEALKGTKFDSEIKIGDDPTFTTDSIYGGHSYWFKDANYPRLMRFKNGLGRADAIGELVYATWLPTKSGEVRRSYTIDLPSTTQKATLISVRTGDIDGFRQRLIVQGTTNKYVVLDSITEMPMFVRLGEEIQDTIPVTPSIASTQSISCDAVSVRVTPLSTALGSAFYQVYYYEKRDSEEDPNTPPIFNISDLNLKVYADTLRCNEFTISGLKYAHDQYYVFVILNDGRGNISAPTRAAVSTGICLQYTVPKTAMRGYQGDTVARDAIAQLFDYGKNDLCFPLRKQPDAQGLETYGHLGEWTGNFQTNVAEIEFPTPYYLDAISLLDGSNSGNFRIEYLESGRTQWKTWLNITTDGYDVWRNYSFGTCPVWVTRMRLTKDANALIRKIILKGRPNTPNYMEAACCSNQNPTFTTVFARDTALTGQSIQNVNILVDNCKLTFNSNFTLRDVTLNMKGVQAAISVQPGTVVSIASSNLKGCSTLWKGITVEPRGILTIDDSYVRDAVIGVQVKRSTSLVNATGFQLTRSYFEENEVGLSATCDIAALCNSGTMGTDIRVDSKIEGCVFDGNFRDLKKRTETSTQLGGAVLGISIGALTASIGSPSGRSNVFNDLGLGIQMQNQIITISNSIFRNIRARKIINPSFGLGGGTYFGSQAITSQDGKFTLKGLGTNANSTPTFDKVSSGIEADYSDFKITDATFSTTGYALLSHFGKTDSSIFNNNKVQNFKGGAINIWKSVGALDIRKNDIDGGLVKDTMFDVVSVGSLYHYNNTNNTATIKIHDNTIRGINAYRNSIINVDDVKGLSIRRDTLQFNNYENNPNRFSSAIKLTSVEQAAVVKNVIIGTTGDTTNTTYAPAQIGILSINSRNDTIACNEINRSRVGLQFQLNNTHATAVEGTIGGNVFKNFNTGIQVDNLAEIGVQTHRRNTWMQGTGTTYNFDALLLGDLSDARLRRNQFTVENAYLPSRVSPISNWFLERNNPTASIIFNCANITNVGIIAPPTGGINLYTSIADSSYQTGSTDPEAYVWMLEKQAFEEFMNLPSHLQTATMVHFLESKQGSDLDIFYQLKKGFESLFEKDPIRAARLKTLNELLETWASKKQDANNDAIAEDVYVGDWSKEYMALGKAEKQASIQKAEVLRQLNGTLPGDIEAFVGRSKVSNVNRLRPYVFYEKVVNDLYLSKIINGIFTFTAKEQAALRKIAIMCPLIAGEAPFKARSMYQHFVNPAPLPEADCSDVPKVIIKKSLDVVQFKIYPNPSNGLVYMMSEIDAPLTWELYAIDGKLIQSGAMKGKIDVLDAKDLPNGLYFLKVSEAGQLRTTLKIAIVK